MEDTEQDLDGFVRSPFRDEKPEILLSVEESRWGGGDVSADEYLGDEIGSEIGDGPVGSDD